MREIPPELSEKLKRLPDSPGVYTHLDEYGNIIYVGKAKNLKHRVKQYFRENITDIKTIKLVENIKDTNWIITDNEVEALLLECNLIKQYRPYYNILLKDDKSYPYIKLTTNENYPRVLLTRKRLADKAKYYGPYSASTNAKKTIEAINRYYPLQMCGKKTEYGLRNGKVCLNYHIGQCCGVCQGNVSPTEYKKYVDEIQSILSGDCKILSDKIYAEMMSEADKLNFELANYLKEMNSSVQAMYDKQKIDSPDFNERDIIAAASDNELCCIQIFFVRYGKIVKSETRYMKKSSDNSDSEAIESFIKQFYTTGEYIPSEIVISDEIAECELLSKMLSELKGSKVSINCPKIGDKKRLTELACKNAMMNIENKRSEKEKSVLLKHRALSEIAQALGMNRQLSRIEAYDISNISGSDNVGGMVVYTDSVKSPKSYRRFRIKYVSARDDYASMSEMVFRRLNRAYEELNTSCENPKFLPLPQLIFVDGGLSHINAVKAVVDSFDFDITVAGLVKDNKHKLRGLMLSNGEEIKQDKFKYAKKLLNDISEEVHRYAIEYHRLSRSKSMLKTELETIPGIGQKRCSALLKYFGSLDKIRNAEIEELASVDGMNRQAAENIYRYFNDNTK